MSSLVQLECTYVEAPIEAASQSRTCVAAAASSGFVSRVQSVHQRTVCTIGVKGMCFCSHSILDKFKSFALQAAPSPNTIVPAAPCWLLKVRP